MNAYWGLIIVTLMQFVQIQLEVIHANVEWDILEMVLLVMVTFFSETLNDQDLIFEMNSIDSKIIITNR